ncbi:MAG: D-glycero-beta-D-manno-heptose-7-phosphate kinase [Alistipes senegalensis]|nr:D-glycero-beta-D-manno-heptose-7-phosphate kinase [Oxalobacter formigenes]MCM1281098.1 D-glycero-beta-D-manno-heptose-7-phosphate kinase [Alistipes senegalensis]
MSIHIRLHSLRVLVVGDIMLDRYWFGEVNRISPEAPVPVSLIKTCEDRLGGAANVARNVASLGPQATLLGIIGNDEAGKSLSGILEKHGIVPLLHCDAAMPTIVKLRVIANQQQLIRIDFESFPSEQSAQSILAQYKKALDKHDVIILSDYAKGAMKHVADMIASARKAGKTVLVDPKGDDFSRYAGATLLTPNKSELRKIIGVWNSEKELEEKAQNLRKELNLDALVLTRSEEGISLYGKEGNIHVSAIAREVFDVSGAGDTVIATLAAMIGAGMEINEAITVANRAGGIVVGKFGTATVTQAEWLE